MRVRGVWTWLLLRSTVRRLQYDDDNKQPIKKGMDYNHPECKPPQHSFLRSSCRSFQLQGIDCREYRLTKKAVLFEKTSQDLNYNTTGASLKNLVIQTNRVRNQKPDFHPVPFTQMN